MLTRSNDRKPLQKVFLGMHTEFQCSVTFPVWLQDIFKTCCNIIHLLIQNGGGTASFFDQVNKKNQEKSHLSFLSLKPLTAEALKFTPGISSRVDPCQHAVMMPDRLGEERMLPLFTTLAALMMLCYYFWHDSAISLSLTYLYFSPQPTPFHCFGASGSGEEGGRKKKNSLAEAVVGVI